MPCPYKVDAIPFIEYGLINYRGGMRAGVIVMGQGDGMGAGNPVGARRDYSFKEGANG